MNELLATRPWQQTLWNVTRDSGFAIRAVLARADSRYSLEVNYGHVARQRLLFDRALDAVERAERLLNALEESGYRRERPTCRTGANDAGQ